MARLIKAGLIALVGAYLVILLRIYLVQRDYLYFPPPPAQPFQIHIKRPDISLGGWIIEGKTHERALVVFGGNAMSLSQWGNGMLRHCTDRTLVLVPYRSYEGNPGHPTETDLVNDGVAVVEWARGQYEHVGVFGVSLGSGVASAVAARTGKDIDMLALGTPYDRMDLVARDHMPWAFPSLLLKDRYDSVSVIQKVQAPIYGLRAEADTIILPPRTQALKAASTGQWIDLPGGHDTVWGSKQACQWLRHATRVH
jgi:pimeloyl-ACP methyl ester carboxylesterase